VGGRCTERTGEGHKEWIRYEKGERDKQEENVGGVLEVSG